jgi:hypothetical protein
MSSRYYALDPHVTLADHSLLGAGWDELDRAGSRALDVPCVAVPSVRVGLGWTLAHYGLSRHRDHVLVPRWTSRCILTDLTRRAMPTEAPTERTRAVLVVHQYGLRQDMSSIVDECRTRAWHCIEDAAYGPDGREVLTPGSAVRFVGLTKTLPVLRGALAITDDLDLAAALRRARAEARPWSLVVLAGLSLLRASARTSGSSQLAEIVYEMYTPARGADRWTRGNILRGIEQLDAFAAESRSRRDHAAGVLGERLLVADLARTPYVGMYFDEDLDGASGVLARNGSHPDIYHIDVARNVLHPEYRKAVLLPFNPRIPRERFEALVGDLARSRH